MTARTDRQPLPLAEAIRKLEHLHANDRRDSILAVTYDPGFATIGGKPFKPVLDIHPGIDWDAGRIFLDIGPKLMAPNEDLDKLKALVRDYSEAIGFVLLALRNTHLAPEARLQAISRTVAGIR